MGLHDHGSRDDDPMPVVVEFGVAVLVPGTVYYVDASEFDTKVVDDPDSMMSFDDELDQDTESGQHTMVGSLIPPRPPAESWDRVPECDRVGAFFDGELSVVLAERFRCHLARCLRCQVALEAAMQLEMFLVMDRPI